jgi:hypothetical protein
MTYLNERVEWTAKTAAQLMVLVANMKENEANVKSKDFDNVIKLRSSNVLVLYHSIIENMTGKGYNTAKDFLTLWANCGQEITNAVRDVHKSHESTRALGTKLNLIEDEFDKSFDDLPFDEESVVSTKDEVAPEA